MCEINKSICTCFCVCMCVSMYMHTFTVRCFQFSWILLHYFEHNDFYIYLCHFSFKDSAFSVSTDTNLPSHPIVDLNFPLVCYVYFPLCYWFVSCLATVGDQCSIVFSHTRFHTNYHFISHLLSYLCYYFHFLSHSVCFSIINEF